MKKVSIYGIGNFGYAILKHLDEKKSEEFSLLAYDRNRDLLQSLKRQGEHLFFHKGQKISGRVNFARSEAELARDCDVLILAVTSYSVGQILHRLRKYLPSGVIIVNTAKALDYDTGARISEVVARELNGFPYIYAVLSGGTIAKDLFDREPLGASIACADKAALKQLARLFTSANLFIYPASDVSGIEYASAFKNVISILAGITKGLGFSYGAETHIISRAAAEVENLVVKRLGGQQRTFAMGSQPWGNDLWMSCTGSTRNREFGILVGGGLSLKAAEQKMQQANKNVEGLNTIKVLPLIPGALDYYILRLISQLFSGQIGLNKFKEAIFRNNG